MRELELNLIPSDIIKQEVLKERIKFWIFWIIGCLVVLLSVNILLKIVNRSAAQDIAMLSSTSEGLSKEMGMVRQLDEREKELLGVREKIQYLSQKGPLIGIFTAIDETINDNITMTHFEVRYNYSNMTSAEGKRDSSGKGYFSSSPSGKNPGSQMTDANAVVLQGNALSNIDLAAMLTLLSKQPLFTKVNLKYSRTGEAEQGWPIVFEIECRLSHQ